MEEGCLILLGIGIGLLVLVVCPALSIYLFVSHRRRLDELEQAVAELRRAPARSERSSAAVLADIASTGLSAAPPPPPPLTTPAPVHAAPKPPPLPAPAPFTPWAAPPDLPPPPVLHPVPAKPPRPPIQWENFLGVKLFAWAGGLIAFLAVAFFVKYSFEHNLVPPPLRVAIGLLCALAALVGGLKLPRERYGALSQSLCASGILILYGTLFAAHALYGLIPSLATFALMCLVTAAAFLLAVRRDARVVAVLGLLGGFATPPLLSTGVDNPLGLFGYLALLDLGLAATVLHRGWTWMLPLAALATVGMQAGWTERFFVQEKAWTAAAVYVAFPLLFSAAFLAGVRRKLADRWTCAAVLLPVASALGFGFYLVGRPYPEIASNPILLFGFVFLADLMLVAPVWVHAPLRPALPVAGFLFFLLLGTWTSGFLEEATLPAGLAFILLFGLLHGVLPAVLQRLKPSGPSPFWLHLFPPLALLLLTPAILEIPGVPLVVWICVLLLDAFAFVAALLTGALAGLLAVLVITIGTLAVAVLGMPARMSGTPVELWLAGGFGALFLFGGGWAVRRIFGPRADSDPAAPGRLWSALFPAFSVLLPFLLLVLVAVRLRPADPSAIFGLAGFLLVLSGFAVVRFGVDAVGAAAGLALVVLEFAWHSGAFQADQAVLPLGWYLGFLGAFLAFPFVFLRRFENRLIPWAAAALAGPGQFYFVYRTVLAAWPNEFMGLLPAALAAPYLAATAVLARRLPAAGPSRLSILACFGGVALFFITAVFPVQFSRQWITVGWALEGAALLWLWRRLPHEGLRIAGAGLLVAAVVRLVPGVNPFVMTWHEREARPILNWILYTYGLVAAAQFAGARFVDPARPRILGVPARPLLQGLGVLLLFLLLNLEIADYYSEGSRFITFRFSGNLAQDMTYSIAWALFAFGLLVAGIRVSSAAARWTGLGLLVATLCKLFLHDLWRLGGLYRIGSLIGLAVVLLAVSFLYQRFLVPKKESAP